VATLSDIVFDCRRASTLAQFWASVLDGYAVAPYDDAEVQRLADLGYTLDTDPTVMVEGPGPRLCFQQVDEAKMTKNRVHLDIRVIDRPAEIERLRRLGATISFENQEWTTMLDPEGNEFCLVESRPPDA
jgi:hypothetical protein